eukprot:3931730-Rhodomonas_salina.3
MPDARSRCGKFQLPWHLSGLQEVLQLLGGPEMRKWPPGYPGTRGSSGTGQVGIPTRVPGYPVTRVRYPGYLARPGHRAVGANCSRRLGRSRTHSPHSIDTSSSLVPPATAALCWLKRKTTLSHCMIHSRTTPGSGAGVCN